MQMTNKMPVVGKRYRSTRYDKPFFLSRIGQDREYLKPWFIAKHESLRIIETIEDNLENFWDYFEEFPEDNKTPNPVNLEKEEVNKVDEAMAELKAMIVPTNYWAVNIDYENLKQAAQKLIDVLKAEKDMSKEEPKIDIKEERVEPVSIWKDVSELPKVPTDCFVKTKPNTSLGVCFGVFQPTNTDNRMFLTEEGRSISKEQTDKYCTLTDFVNSFEQMQKDI